MDDLDTLALDEDSDPPEPKSGALSAATEGAALPMSPRTRAMVDALYRQHAGLVHKKLARRDISPASARDLHQQVFVTLGHRIQKDGCLDNPEAMLTTITLGKICNYLRRKKRRPVFAAEIEAETIPASLSKVDVERAAREAECQRIVEGLLTRLDGYDAALIALIDIDGMTYGTAAWLFERPLATIRTQHRRAREKLRALVERLYKEEMAPVERPRPPKAGSVPPVPVVSEAVVQEPPPQQGSPAENAAAEPENIDRVETTEKNRKGARGARHLSLILAIPAPSRSLFRASSRAFNMLEEHREVRRAAASMPYNTGLQRGPPAAASWSFE